VRPAVQAQLPFTHWAPGSQSAAVAHEVLQAAFEDAAKTPEGRKALTQAARAAGIGSKTFQRAGISVRDAESLTRIISDETAKRLAASVRKTFSEAADYWLKTHSEAACDSHEEGSQEE
jgi:hypothetical protein